MYRFATLERYGDERHEDGCGHAHERPYLDLTFYARLLNCQQLYTIRMRKERVISQLEGVQSGGKPLKAYIRGLADVPVSPICPDSPPGSYCLAVLRPAQRPTWYLAVTDSSALAWCGSNDRMGEDVASSCARPRPRHAVEALRRARWGGSRSSAAFRLRDGGV
jgi:hypothetical protein